MPDQEYTLVAVETASIQPYIYGSNRLQENVGASYLVAEATGNWALAAIIEAVGEDHCNITQRSNTGEHSLDDKAPKIEDTAAMQAEVLYAGGGNVVVLFRQHEHAVTFGRTLSRRVLTEAPGLRIVMASTPYKWSAPLAKAVGDLLNDIRQERSKQPPYTTLLGQGVTVMGNSSSLPAVTYSRYDDDITGATARYAANIVAKQRVTKLANERLRTEVLDLDNRYRYPLDFDELGRSEGELSLIAVVHMDGNGIGKIIRNFAQKYGTTEQNRDYIKDMRAFSEGAKVIATHAMQNTIKHLLGRIDDGWIHGYNDQPSIEVTKKNGQSILPFRPLITGGDDVTFVCDGRLGIALAVRMIEYFEEAARHIFPKHNLTACAGVAIVNVHYPFARAYDLADELCDEAKKLRAQVAAETGAQVTDVPSALDWHIGMGGVYDDLDNMREREYEVYHNDDAPRSLTLRPVLLDQVNGHSTRNWANIERVAVDFQLKWQESRNKAKQLMDALRRGPDATRLFKTRYLDELGLVLPDFAEGGPVENGWLDDRCAYYDALELMDLYVPLPGNRL